MDIGIPKEVKVGERRVALTPEACLVLRRAGHTVRMGKGAGQAAGWSDDRYAEVGVDIVADAKTLYRSSTLIVKVKEPEPDEWRYLEASHILFCYLHLAAHPTLAKTLQDIGLTAIAFETVEESGRTPLLAPMSAIAGRLSVQMGAYYLQASHGGRGVLLGGTSHSPAGQVTIIGVGAAGSEAVAMAQGMGAHVTALDIHQDRLKEIKARFPQITPYPLSPSRVSEWLPKTDLLIGAASIPGKHAPPVVSEAQIKTMLPGSVVIDIAIDQGGCIATSHPCTYENPIYLCHGIIHSAITNLPAAVPETASLALSRAILPYVLLLANGRWSEALKKGVNIEDHKNCLKTSPSPSPKGE